jgi:vancomycin resistance protein YoaR
VSIAPTLEREALRAAIEAIAGRFDRDPVPPEIDDAGRLVTHPEPGRAIDVEATVDRIADGLVAGDRRFSMVVRERPVPTDPARFARAQEPVVLGSYVTRYRMRGDEGPRAVNVRVAAEALDGAVIPPGGRLSFNERVGPRTPGRGYRVAHVIYDGEMVDGIGGGVCQVASTLHASAFLAGLPIVAQVPHSRPSAYIPMGLDATVVYPEVDLVIGNPLPVPITVRAHADGGRMEVALWARARAPEVDWRREVLARTGYEERVIEDPAVPVGERRVSQEGGPGFVIERVRTVRDVSGERTERRTLRYPPTDLVVRVGPGLRAGDAPGGDQEGSASGVELAERSDAVSPGSATTEPATASGASESVAAASGAAAGDGSSPGEVE